MVSFNFVAATIVAVLTTSVVAAPIPVYIGAVRVADKPIDSIVGRALLPRGPVSIGATRVVNPPDLITGTTKREVAPRHAKNIMDMIANVQTKIDAILPILDTHSTSVPLVVQDVETDLLALESVIENALGELEKAEQLPATDTVAADMPVAADVAKALGQTVKPIQKTLGSLTSRVGSSTVVGVVRVVDKIRAKVNQLIHDVDDKVPGVLALVGEITPL